jgi:hypothetical protein
MHHVDQNHMDIIPYGWMTWILEKKSKATEKFVASVTFSKSRCALWIWMACGSHLLNG